jgi:hypothetical protein
MAQLAINNLDFVVAAGVAFNIDYCTVTNSTATGAGIPIIAITSDGNVDGTGNTGWNFGTYFVLDAAAGSYAISGTAADLLYGRVLDAAAGSYAISGTATDLLYGRVLDAAAGSYAISGTAASLELGRVIIPEAGTYSLTGTSSSLEFGRVLAAATGAYTISGTDVGLSFVPVIAYEVAAAAGSYAISGTDANLVFIVQTHTITIDFSTSLDGEVDGTRKVAATLTPGDAAVVYVFAETEVS